MAINELIRRVLCCPLPNARGAYIAPFYKQAKNVAWDYLRQFTQDIPDVKFNQSELKVDFPNGARIQLYGGDNPDSLRGIYLDCCDPPWQIAKEARCSLEHLTDAVTPFMTCIN
jgi:hypothetical protein